MTTTRQRPEDIMAQQARERGAEFCALVSQSMKDTSEPIKEKPKKLYHATRMGNLSSIMDKGILPHDVYGNIYFCESQKHCLKFVEKPCLILEIDTSQLDNENLFISKDHNKRIYKFDCYTYFATIPPSAIKNWRAF
jgi:RNA:NAD 2'-phosphotransferase (TPT1/KptA family)